MDTTRPTTAQLVQAIEAAFSFAKSENEAVNVSAGEGCRIDEPLTAGQAAFTTLLARMEALEAFVARVVERSDSIDSEDVEVVNNLMARNNAFDVIEGRKLLKELKGE